MAGELQKVSRSRDDRIIAGVLGGLARRWNIDAGRLRVVFVAASVLSAAFPGLLVYLALWYLFPED